MRYIDYLAYKSSRYEVTRPLNNWPQLNNCQGDHTDQWLLSPWSLSLHPKSGQLPLNTDILENFAFTMKSDMKLHDLSSSSSPSSFRRTMPNTVSLYNESAVREAQHQYNENDEREERHVVDCGARAWLAVVAGFINFFAGFGRLTFSLHLRTYMNSRARLLTLVTGLLNSWGTFQAKYPDEPWGQSTSLAEISWIGSVQVSETTPLQIPDEEVDSL